MNKKDRINNRLALVGVSLMTAAAFYKHWILGCVMVYVLYVCIKED